jgi:hypothetical protein
MSGLCSGGTLSAGKFYVPIDICQHFHLTLMMSPVALLYMFSKADNLGI